MVANIASLIGQVPNTAHSFLNLKDMKLSKQTNLSIQIFLLGYFGFSYVFLELNPINWSEDTRLVFLLFSICVFANRFAMPKSWFE